MPEVIIPYVERDVSWMYFNHRILQEAEKEYVPLLERLSFLGIYSNNLDEFFRVRVASLSRIAEDKNLDKRSYHKIKRSLKAINQLNELFSKEYTEAVDIVGNELTKHNIRLVNETQLNDDQKQYLRNFFYEELNGAVNPIWLSQIREITSLEDNRIYLIVERCEVDTGKIKYAIVKVPDRSFGRWIKIPSCDGNANIMYLDDVVRFCLPYVFIGMKESTYRAYSFKFTKDAEMEIDNEADYGTMEKIAAGVNSRKRGEAVRVVYDGEMPKAMLKQSANASMLRNWTLLWPAEDIRITRT